VPADHQRLQTVTGFLDQAAGAAWACGRPTIMACGNDDDSDNLASA
jgi:hypothetical protein